MKIKKIAKYVIGTLGAIFFYLVIAGVWASISVTELLPNLTTSNDQFSLTEEQSIILLKIEDPTFYNHVGIDISPGQGLTTITSSLAYNIFLSGKKLEGVKGAFQSFYRAVFACCKIVDLGRDVMALVLNKNLSKEKQLQLFISSVYMGQYNRKSVIGLRAAASAYFKKNLSDLSRDEFITLVAMLEAPNYYHPINGPKQLNSRILKIKSILSGACQPKGWLDTKYEHCKGNA